MEFPDFNNQEDHDQIQVENVDNVFGYNNEQYQPHVNNENSYPVVSDPAGAGWNSALVDTHSRINDLTMTIDDEEEKRIAARRQEEEERRSRIVQLMNDEMRIKQEWRNKAQEFMENVESQRASAIEKRHKINKSNEEEMLENRKLSKEGKLNPWEKVVKNIEVKESEYKGSKDISRMRSVILNRKNDFTQMKMK